MKGWDVLIVVLLLLIGGTHAGLWITLPSAENGCGKGGCLQEDTYFWDTENFEGDLDNQLIFFTSTLPKGDYYYYHNSSDNSLINSDVRQYFCTGYVDSMPVGSYCFYQNIQNCNSFSFSFSKIS